MKWIVIILAIVSIHWSCDYQIIDPHDHEVGYIDPSKALDEGFEACFEEKIFPYYYGRKPARFDFGKDSLKRYFVSQYNDFGDFSQTGYITFRFVINCKGEAGRFVTESVGHDFEKKEFNPKIVDGLYKALSQLKGWQPIQFYDDKYDSYYHITFKIVNGELLEILP